MTTIRETTIRLNCARLGPPSRLPRFREQQATKVQPVDPVGLDAAETENLVAFGALSMLPYLEQNDYDRVRRPQDVQALILENDDLRATVLPGLGGRLHSLFDKRGERELLFANPVFQPANLSLRNAWFSGGIEWNGGAVPGHSASTCAPVFCHVVETGRGPILRIHEFDRISETAWQVDLFLPSDQPRLYVHGRIVNPNDAARLVYWWTNVAVAATPGLRVLSPADYAIEHAPDDGHLERYRFPDQWGFDGSYPHNWQRATSVFFRRSGQRFPWIAAVENDGSGLAQLSTGELVGRKYFYFGAGAGGRHWMDYLSEPGRGDYLEIQAGITPTQNQRLTVAAGSSVSWTECYQPIRDDMAETAGPYARAVATMEDRLAVAAAPLETADVWLRDHADARPTKTLSRGENWGQLHEVLTGNAFGRGLDFAGADDTDHPWASLALDGRFDTAHLDDVPRSFVVSPTWENALRRSMDQSGPTWLHHLALAIIALDRDELTDAEAQISASAALKPTWLAVRCLALIAARRGEVGEAADLYERALEDGGAPDELFVEAAMYLNSVDLTERLDRLLARIPASAGNHERLRLLRAERAVLAGDYEATERLLDHDFASIREGELTLSRIWERLVLGRAEREAGRNLDEGEKAAALAASPIPERLNFTMNTPAATASAPDRI